MSFAAGPWAWRTLPSVTKAVYSGRSAMSDWAYCLAKSIAALPAVEAVHRLGVRLGDLREVRHEVGRLRERRPGGLAVRVGELPLDPLELVGEAAQFVVAALVVGADRVDRPVDLVLDVRGDGPARFVGQEARRPHVLDVLDRGPGVRSQEGDLGLLDQRQHRVDRAAADEAGQHVDLVLLDQLGGRQDGGRRAVALVRHDELDLPAAQLVAVGLQVQLEAVPQLRADRLVGAGQGGHQADLHGVVVGAAVTAATGDGRQAEGEGGGTGLPESAAVGTGQGGEEHGGSHHSVGGGASGAGRDGCGGWPPHPWESGSASSTGAEGGPTGGQRWAGKPGSRTWGDSESPTWLISSDIM